MCVGERVEETRESSESERQVARVVCREEPKYSEVQQITTKHSPAQHNSACHTLEAREEGGTVVASRERTHVKGEEPTDRLVTSNTRMYTSML